MSKPKMKKLDPEMAKFLNHLSREVRFYTAHAGSAEELHAALKDMVEAMKPGAELSEVPDGAVPYFAYSPHVRAVHIAAATLVLAGRLEAS